MTLTLNLVIMYLRLCLFLLRVVQQTAVISFIDDHLLNVSCVVLWMRLEAKHTGRNAPDFNWTPFGRPKY